MLELLPGLLFFYFVIALLLLIGAFREERG